MEGFLYHACDTNSGLVYFCKTITNESIKTSPIFMVIQSWYFIIFLFIFLILGIIFWVIKKRRESNRV